MKRVVIAIILLFVISCVAYADDFTDVPEDHWAYLNIYALSDSGVINGYPDGTFKPSGPTTRAEFFKLISIVEADNMAVEDYKKGVVNWYDPYVEFIFENEMNMENTDRNNVDVPITRKEATMVLANFAKFNEFLKDYDNDDSRYENSFTDVENFSEQDKYLLNYVVKSGLITGYEDGSFQPEKTITRAEVATILCRFCNKWVEVSE